MCKLLGELTHVHIRFKQMRAARKGGNAHFNK